MGDNVSTTSRRTLLRALTVAPVVGMTLSVTSPRSEGLATLHAEYGDEPITLVRTKGGRSLSRWRYHRAEGFFPDPDPRSVSGWHDFLYISGITAQLGLSAHLLDVGFPDDWNARHIGLRVAKALAYANATGLGHDCPEMARLAAVLTPYCQWNQLRLFGEPTPDDGGFNTTQIRVLLRALLDRVHDVTGHPRPSGWHRRQREARS